MVEPNSLYTPKPVPEYLPRLAVVILNALTRHQHSMITCSSVRHTPPQTRASSFDILCAQYNATVEGPPPIVSAHRPTSRDPCYD